MSNGSTLNFKRNVVKSIREIDITIVIDLAVQGISMIAKTGGSTRFLVREVLKT